MDFGLFTVGWRDLVLGLAALMGVYLALSVMKLFQVAGKRPSPAPIPAENRLDFDFSDIGDDDEPYDRPPAFSNPAGVAAPAAQAAAPAPAATMQTERPSPAFADELARTSLDVEVNRLRREAHELRTEMTRLADEVAHLKAARNVSPLYNEAMSLAQQGMTADGIAGHCGISIGEAELVAALARNDSGFERQDDDEDPNERHHRTGS